MKRRSDWWKPGGSKHAPRHQCQKEVQGQWWPPEGPENSGTLDFEKVKGMSIRTNYFKRALFPYKNWTWLAQAAIWSFPAALLYPSQPHPEPWEFPRIKKISIFLQLLLKTWTATVLADNFSFMAATLPKSRTIAASSSPSGSPDPGKSVKLRQPKGFRTSRAEVLPEDGVVQVSTTIELQSAVQPFKKL